MAELHGYGGELRVGLEPEKKLTDNRVMAIRKGVAFHQDVLADGALDGIAAAVDRRTNRLDDDARRRSFIQA
jgi:hypothetical protein